MKCIFIGPNLMPYTGQSIAFNNLVKNASLPCKCLEYGGEHFLSKFFSSLSLITRFLFISVIHRLTVKVVYITTSRTIIGFFRDFIIITICRILGIRVVNHLHGADFISFRSGLNPVIRSIVDCSYNYIDTSIVLLPSMKEQYSMYKNMNIEVVSNGVDDFYSSNVIKKNNHISYLSNIMYTKGIIYLIDAIIELNESKGKRFTLSIAGKFMADEEMSSDQIRKLFTEKIAPYEYIEYLGVVSGKAKSKLLNESEIFVLPTFYKTEAQPLAIMEAMGCGNAIISTRHNYIPDIVDSRHGSLVTIRSTCEIVDALMDLTESKDSISRLMESNRTFANEHYSLECYINKTLSIIQREIT